MTRTDWRGGATAAFAAAALLAPGAAVAAPPSHMCAFGYDKPVVCRVYATASADGATAVTFQAEGRRAVFTGRSQSGWWSGRLNGSPAMGYELNRGHTVYSSLDLRTVFEHWSPGLQHGAY